MQKSESFRWPVAIRIIHWVVAVIVLLDAFVLEEGDPAHRYLGYVAFVAVLARFFWKGVHVSLKSFPLNAKELKLFLFDLFKGKHHDYEGHNPLASFVYILMWLIILGLTLSGWMMGLDAFWGDERVEKVHAFLSDALLVLVLIHLCGVVLDSIRFKRKTWMGMITGKKQVSKL